MALEFRSFVLVPFINHPPDQRVIDIVGLRFKPEQVHG